MNRLRRYLIWLFRCRHSRGFGIQSPTDYAFVRYVINEHYPYYGYLDMESEYPSLMPDVRKLMELYFRISNWLQADYAIVCSNNKDECLGYIGAGCRKTMEWESDSVVELDEKTCLIVLGKDAEFDRYSEALEKANDRTVVIMEDIYGSNKGRWEELVADDAVTVSYDLYYAGIATFDRTRYKTNYIINF